MFSFEVDDKALGRALLCMALCVLSAGQAYAAGSSYNRPGLQSGVNIGVVSSADNVLTPDRAASQSGNTITLGDGSSADPYYVFGGLDVQSSHSGTASDNTVSITGGAVARNPGEAQYSASVTGGFAYSNSGSSSTASGNRVVLNSSAITVQALTGGWASMLGSGGVASAGSNVVMFSSGLVDGAFGVTGGWAYTGGESSTTNGNSVSMSGGAVNSDSGVTGGWAEVHGESGTATANSNTLNMSGGVVSGGASGSLAAGGLLGGLALNDNTSVNSSGDSVASGNRVGMSGGTLNGGGGVTGGWANVLYSVGGITATASNNTVAISGGTIDGGGEVYGGWTRVHNSQDGQGDVNATGNRVTISNVTMHSSSGNGTLGQGANVFGGWGRVSSLHAARGNGTVSDNSLTMNSGTVGGGLFGGYVYGYNGVSVAAGNNVILNDGTVGTSVYGGWARGSGGTATATGNSVFLNGGTVSGNVYGGYAQAGVAGVATATGNTVSLSGTPTFGGTTTLYGGYATGDGTPLTDFARTISGNTLHVRTAGIQVAGVKNFENYVFQLPANSGLTLLRASSPVALSGGLGSGAWQSNVSLGGIGAGSGLSKGYTVKLIDNVDPAQSAFTINGKPFSADNNRISGVGQGYSRSYTLLLSLDAAALTAAVADVSVSPGTRAPVEGRSAAFTSLTAGADLVAGQGMSNAKAAGAATSAAPGMGMAPFAAVGGGHVRYNAGSHVSVNGVSYVAGLAHTSTVGAGLLLGGIFFESGYSSYNAYTDYADGRGHSSYYGGGLLGRYEVTEGMAAGVHAETSFRAGALHNRYTGEGTPLGQPGYTTHSPYYGWHAGLGYVWNLTDKGSLDLYGKYFWVHQTGQDVHMLGDRISLKDMDSHRIRLGGRFTCLWNESLTPYIGAAWEYEFDGKARATTYGMDVPASSLKGSTGVGELGITWRPVKATGFSVDAGGQGYVGMRQGVSGNLMLKYEF